MTDGAAGTRLLVVEDDPDDARMMFRVLRGQGRFNPLHARTASEGLEAAAAETFSACLVDYRLPDMSGIEMCRRLRSMGFLAPILMLSSVQADEVVARARAAGANNFMVKRLSYCDHLVAEVEGILGA